MKILTEPPNSPFSTLNNFTIGVYDKGFFKKLDILFPDKDKHPVILKMQFV